MFYADLVFIYILHFNVEFYNTQICHESNDSEVSYFF